MAEKEVVQCINGPYCLGDHHGWDCPASDPLSDVLAMWMDPSPNPLLERARRGVLEDYGVIVEPLEERHD